LSACPASLAWPGATPIQNVNAYGQDVADTIVAVRAYDRRRDTAAELSNADCGFGYRTSFFKRTAAGAATGRFIVLDVTFRLVRDPLSAPVRYAELARSLGIAEGGRVPLAAARDAVLRLRRAKGMVLDPADPDTRSVGSFFTNPVLDSAQFAALSRAVAARVGADVRIPCFAAECGRVKIPAAWLIERAGFGKGYAGSGRPLPAGQPGPGQPGQPGPVPGPARPADLDQAHARPGQSGWRQHHGAARARQGNQGRRPRYVRRSAGQRTRAGGRDALSEDPAGGAAGAPERRSLA
jgi:hypothetical protein